MAEISFVPLAHIGDSYNLNRLYAGVIFVFPEKLHYLLGDIQLTF